MKPLPYPKKLITPPTNEPVGLEELCKHVQVAPGSFIEELTGFGIAARENVENLCGVQLVNATWKIYLPCIPHCDAIELPLYPLQSVTSITFTDSTETDTTWTASGSNLIDSNLVVRAHVDNVSEPGRIVLAYNQSWPSLTLKKSNPIAIHIVAGYGEPGDVPWSYKLAIKYLVGHFFLNREAATVGTLMEGKELPMGVAHILARYGQRSFQ